MSPVHILYALAGSPPQDTVPMTGRCRMCAQPLTEGQLFTRWAGSSFTDQNKVRDAAATHVCPACIWAHAWSPPPGSPPREGRGHNLRMYSHLWHNGEYRYLNKADKPAILAFLRADKPGPWFAAISDTGQKHLLPYAPLNPPGCRRPQVRFEEQTLPLGDWALCDAIAALLTAGATKAEVEAGDYAVRSWRALESEIRAFEDRWSSHRGGAWLALCLWLAQRDEQEYQRRQDGQRLAREAEKRDDRVAAGRAQPVSHRGSKPAEALGPTPESPEKRGSDKHQRPGVDHRPGPQPRPTGPYQASLFGD